LRTYEAKDPAGLEHPYFALTAPCTMLIDEVEALWAPIAARDDWAPFEAKLASVQQMAAAYGNEAATIASN
jgi:hypothetical protein